MTKGYVYVLSNPAMPGYLKIGRSIHGGRSRAVEIDGTGVPYPFELEFECFFEDCVEAESLVHEELEEWRTNPKREFFRMDVSAATQAVLRICANFIDNTVVEIDYTVCSAGMCVVAHKFNLCPPEPYQIVDFISDSAWVEAIRAYRERYPDRLIQTNVGLTLVDPRGSGDFELPPTDCAGCGERVSEYSEINGHLFCDKCFHGEVSA